MTDVSIGAPLANVRLLKYCSTTSNPKKQRLSKGFFVFFAKISSLPFPTSRLWHMADVSPARVIFVGGLPRDATEVGGEKCHGESTLPGLGNGFPMISFIYIYIRENIIFVLCYIYIYYIYIYRIYVYIYVYIYETIRYMNISMYIYIWVCILVY